MDPNLFKNLGLNSSLNPNDQQLINQLLGSIGTNTKTPQMSIKERNNLINKLTSTNTLNELPKKELKDMNEEEKKIYKEELTQRVKKIQNDKKMSRTGNVSNNNTTDVFSKITEMMKNMDPNILGQLTNNISQQINTETDSISATTLNELPKKELKDMNEEEKKIYKEELTQRVKKIQNEKKIENNSNNNDNTNIFSKITEMMKNMDPNILGQLTNNISQQINTETLPSESTHTNKTNIKQIDIINNIINKNNIEDTTEDTIEDNLDDYIN
jgi:hypothetical protein